MTKKIKLIAVSIFVLTYGFSLTLRSAAAATPSIEAYFSKLESPRSLYLNNCARCHGGDGKSQTEQGRLNDTPDISGGRLRNRSSKRLTKTIANGDDKMPAFGKRLTKAQISSLVNYVRRL